MTVGSSEAVAWIASFVFIFWETSTTSGPAFRDYYNEYLPRLPFQIPGYVFGGVWFVLKTTIFLALGFYLTENANVSLAILIIWVINEYLRKMWTVAFMDWKRPNMALVINMGIFGTALYLVIGLGTEEQWLPMGLLIPYVLWVAVAIVLNIQWIRTVTNENPLLEKPIFGGSKRAVLKQ